MTMAAGSRPCVLVFAGLDPSGGAGLLADAQAVAAQGAHALTVCTALTVQDNDRVHGVQPVDPELVLRQARALAGKMTIGAVKVGITGSAANARAIAEFVAWLRARDGARVRMPGPVPVPGLPLVLDPVLASGHGDLLSRDDAVQALAPLLPLATVLTPNGPEARALSGATQPDAQAAALHARGCRHVLITGGHGDGDEVINRWYGHGSDAARDWRWPRLAGEFHGSGCTLASAIAGQLASGAPLARALEQAQHYVHNALRQAYAIAPGQRIPTR